MTNPIKERFGDVRYYVQDAMTGMENHLGDQVERLVLRGEEPSFRRDFRNSPIFGGKVLLDEFLGSGTGFVAGLLAIKEFGFLQNGAFALAAVITPSFIGFITGMLWEPAKIGRRIRKGAH